MTRGRRLLAALGLVLLAGAWTFAAVRLWRTSVPADLKVPDLDPRRYFSDSQLERAADYQRFLRIDQLLAALAQVVALGVFALKGERFVRESAAGRIGTGMLLGMLALAFVWFAQLPFDLAAVWWERKHGVLDLGYAEWLLEDWLSVGGQFLFVSFALLVVMAMAGRLRGRWWLAGGPAIAAVGLAFAVAQPYLMPDQHSLDDPRIAADARRLAAASGVPGTPVRVQETLDESESPNAAAAGLAGSERVILWDTLVEAFDPPEVRAVLAHEFAHISRDHILKLFLWLALLAIPIGLVMELATRRRGGLREPTSVPLAVFVVVTAMLLVSPAQNGFSRRLEAEADWIALETTRDPAAARRLHQRFTELALAQPTSPGWARALFEGHPTGMERIGMAEAWRARR